MGIERRVLAILAGGACLAASLAAAPAFRLDVGPAVAAGIEKAKSVAFALRAVDCNSPGAVKVTAVAEGLVNGARRSLPQRVVTYTTPGVFGVAFDWPAGVWVVSVTASCPGLPTVGAIVPMQEREFQRDALVKLEHAPTMPEVDAALAKLARAPAPRRTPPLQ